MTFPDPPLEPHSPSTREIFSVSQINNLAKSLLEDAFPLTWVTGEISNWNAHPSGHWYFVLKDAQASVQCAMFRGRNRTVLFRPDNGSHVVVRAQVSLYEARGQYQLIVEQMEEAGEGALQRAFEQLKQRLAAEGLFDTHRKRALPTMPRAIGVVTSPSGAALRDILSVLRRRFPALPVIIYPVPVQGSGAAARIAAMIHTASVRAEVDVLIIARGGGSLEDLWAFNEEVVARAIHACTLPVVSGVGHETDFSIADFVADHRAPTPSVAAEMASPQQDEWQAAYVRIGQRLRRLMTDSALARHQRLTWLSHRLHQQHPKERVRRLTERVMELRRRLHLGHAHQLARARVRQQGLSARLRALHPERRLRSHAQRLDELAQRLQLAMRARLHQPRARVETVVARLQRHVPVHSLLQLQTRHAHLAERLYGMMQLALERAAQRVHGASRALDAVSPLATLARGYAITRREADGAVVRAAQQLTAGEVILTQVAIGQVRSAVLEVRDDSGNGG